MAVCYAAPLMTNNVNIWRRIHNVHIKYIHKKTEITFGFVDVCFLFTVGLTCYVTSIGLTCYVTSIGLTCYVTSIGLTCYVTSIAKTCT